MRVDAKNSSYPTICKRKLYKGVLNVKVGACVMVMTNIDVCYGLTNGVMGSVSGVVEKRDKIHVILVEFDSDSVGMSAKEKGIYNLTRYPNALPIGK